MKSRVHIFQVLLAINERLLRNLKFRLIFLLLNGAAFVGCVFWQKKAIGKLLDIQDDVTFSFLWEMVNLIICPRRAAYIDGEALVKILLDSFAR